MKGKLRNLLLLLLFFPLLALSGCGKYEQIKLTSVKVESLNMNGFRSIDLVLSVGVDNPAGKVVVKEAVGTLRHSGKIIGKVTLAPLVIKARTMSDYKVGTMVRLADGVGIQKLMGLMDARELERCTVDIEAKGKASGITVKKKYNDIPLKKLLEGSKHEKI